MNQLITDQVRGAIRETVEGDGSITLNELAIRTGIDVSTLSRFMRGERGISGDTLSILCSYFKLILVREDGNRQLPTLPIQPKR